LCESLGRTTLSSTATKIRTSPRIIADPETGYVFIAGLYQTNSFAFENPAAWSAIVSCPPPRSQVDRGAHGIST
jgi:hypothetical protein